MKTLRKKGLIKVRRSAPVLLSNNTAQKSIHGNSTTWMTKKNKRKKEKICACGQKRRKGNAFKMTLFCFCSCLLTVKISLRTHVWTEGVDINNY